MLIEAREASAAVATQLAHNDREYNDFGAFLRERNPGSLLTVARGSSDHAAHFMAYLIMARLGRLVTSLPMSLVTLYQSHIQCKGLVSMAFSQSGQSPDLVAPMRYFTQGGACTAAFVNDPNSPLAQASQWVFPLHAGAETSVAATKSFITQLVAGARVVAAWQQDLALHAALSALPGTLSRAANADWSVAVDVLRKVDRLFVIGRGTGLPVAMEAALKQGFATATDLADYLVKRGVPFRDAHEVVARAVRVAETKRCDLAELPLSELQAFSPLIDKDVFDVLSVEGSLAARDHVGGTAPAQVRVAIARVRAALED